MKRCFCYFCCFFDYFGSFGIHYDIYDETFRTRFLHHAAVQSARPGIRDVLASAKSFGLLGGTWRYSALFTVHPLWDLSSTLGDYLHVNACKEIFEYLWYWYVLNDLKCLCLSWSLCLQTTMFAQKQCRWWDTLSPRHSNDTPMYFLSISSVLRVLRVLRPPCKPWKTRMLIGSSFSLEWWP